MIVICIKQVYSLTCGSKYEVRYYNDDFYYSIGNESTLAYFLENDLGLSEWYSGDFFITLEEFRDEQINKIIS